jgi:hypothetical protein
MKKIDGFSKKILNLEGKEYNDHTTRKDMLMRCLFGSRVVEADKAIRITTKLIPMLQATKHSNEFEDGDYDLMKAIAEKNELALNIGIFGQLMQLFEESKESK